MTAINAALFALVGGLLPAIIWLRFWLKEDTKHPEPRGRIILTFLVGAVAVLVVLPFEKLVGMYFADSSLAAFIAWAALEELAKYGAAYFTALRTRFYDEPIDAVVYMMTAALGFSALENTFFIVSPLIQGNALDSVITSNLRFVGASLLHIVASGIVGALIGFAFYKKPSLKRYFALIGLIIAVALHTLFNFFIISNDSKDAFLVFTSIWVSIIVLILLIERIKFIKKTN
jgi:RsiW-degrading membrane proteinase PrsW (M82 family)